MTEKGKIKGFVFSLSLMELLVPGFLVLMMTPLEISSRFFLVCTLPLCAGLILGSILMRRRESEEGSSFAQCLWMLGLPFVSLVFGLLVVIPLQGWLMVVFCIWAPLLVLMDFLAVGAIRSYQRRQNFRDQKGSGSLKATR